MTNEQKTEAPEQIWAGGFADDGTGWQHHTELTSPIGTEYVRADLAAWDTRPASDGDAE